MGFRNELLVDGTVLHSCGLGMSMRNILLALAEQGCRVRINSSFETRHAGIIEPGQWERLKALKNTVISDRAPLLVRGPLGFGSLPRHIRRLGQDRYTIFYTVTEVDRLNAIVRAEASAADEIWVPTDFDLVKFRKFKEQAFKVHYFTDSTRYHPGVIPDPELKAKCKGFTFLFSGSGVYRKGLLEACRAYFNAFTDRDDVTLVVLNKEINLETLLAQAGRAHALPRLVFLDKYLHESKMPATYACADALLLPSRAEGWSHPAMEFACMGKPVIMTDYGGQREFLDEESAWLVPVDGLAPDPKMHPLSAQYQGAFFPVLGDGFMRRLGATLRDAKENRHRVNIKGCRALEKARKHFTPENTVSTILDRLRGIEADMDAGKVPHNPWKSRLLGMDGARNAPGGKRRSRR